MTLERVGTSKDEEAEKNFQEIFDKAQSKQLVNFGETVPEGQMNGERIGLANIGGQNRVYFRCPDGSWCYVALT